MAGGLILLLSQLSYSPADLPEWGMFEAFADKGDKSGDNWLGPVGGILAFVQILLFGAAGWMLALGFIWFGVLKLAFRGSLWPRIVLGLVVVLVSGSVFLHATGIFFDEWAARCRMPSPGGVIGNGLGGFVLMPIISSVGTAILTAIAYLVGLVWLTGQTPVNFGRGCYHLVKRKIDAWKMSRTEAGRADARERELLNERERQREQRRVERELTKLKEAETDTPGQKELAIRETPAPQIIDSSQRRATGGAAVGEKPFERKKPGHQSLSVTGFEDYELPGFDLLEWDDENEEPPRTSRRTPGDPDDHCRDPARPSGWKSRPATSPAARPLLATKSTRPPASALAAFPSWRPTSPAPPEPSASTFSPPFPERTPSASRSPTQKVAVPLRELLQDDEFRTAKRKIPLALGKDVYGNTVIGDLAAMPHLLVAGATGAGKSVCINSIITSILYKFGPDELRFIMIDPKVVEMQMYNKLPHLVVPVVTDPKKVVAALKWW